MNLFKRMYVHGELGLSTHILEITPFPNRWHEKWIANSSYASSASVFKYMVNTTYNTPHMIHYFDVEGLSKYT